MPPINQQGNRAPLVTALVVFTILFVVSAVMAFHYYSKWEGAVRDAETSRKAYTEAVSDAELGPTVTTLLGARNEQPPRMGITRNDSALAVAVKQRDDLEAKIVGSVGEQTPAAVDDAAAKAIADAATALKNANSKVDLTGAGLAAAVKTLTDATVAAQNQVAEVTRQRDDANKLIAADKADFTANNTKRDQDLADARKTDTDQLQQVQASVDANNKTMADAQAAYADAAKKSLDAQTASAGQLADSGRQLQQSNDKIRALQGRLENRRPNVSDSVVRQVDGRIIRVPGNGVCYINLGMGDQVTPGLTFEVYDKADGVPGIPPNVTGDEQLPVGKASIEIVRVGNSTSECRIVHTAPGAILSEGDLIENLVYDPHTKYNFFVYGNFDLAGTNRPNPADTEVIKRLVTQWGGRLATEVNVNTDFVVLGAEPTLPNFSKDDLTPENQDKLQKAQEALDKYQEIRQAARDYHIPLMNQNRFLYYVGYYDQAKR